MHVYVVAYVQFKIENLHVENKTKDIAFILQKEEGMILNNIKRTFPKSRSCRRQSVVNNVDIMLVCKRFLSSFLFFLLLNNRP